MTRWAFLLLCSCSFENQGLTDIAPTTWTARIEDQAVQVGEVTYACEWTCVAKKPDPEGAYVACAKGDSTVYVFSDCLGHKGSSAALLDGCRVEVTCGGMGL